MTPSQAKRLVGRTIVAVDLDADWAGEGHSRVLMHDPTITLDDGSRLRFVVEEAPDGGEYGVDLVHAGGRRTPKASDLIRELAAAVDDELTAAGADEVRQHPAFASKARLLDRVERYLKAHERTET